MKSSEFMDKQIMQLSNSQNKESFSVLDPDEDSEDDCGDDRSYGFRRIRGLGPSQPPASTLLNCSSVDHIDSAKGLEENFGMAVVSEINQTIKAHFDDILYLVHGLSARVSQLESKSRKLENSADDLKVCAEYNNGKIDGKLRQLESILREVQGGIYFLKDRQEIAEAQLQLAKLQVSENVKQTEKLKTTFQSNASGQVSSSASVQCTQPLPISAAPALSILYSDISSTLHQNASPSGGPATMQLQAQIMQNPIPCTTLHQSYYLPVGETLGTTNQQCNVLSNQQVQPPPLVSSPLHQPSRNLPQISKPTQFRELHPPLGSVTPQIQPPWTCHCVETPAIPSQSYQAGTLPSSQPHSGIPMQQFCLDSREQMHGQPLRRTNL